MDKFEEMLGQALDDMVDEEMEIREREKQSYNQALEDIRNGIKEILEDNAIYNIDCIDTLVKQLSL